MKNRIRWFAVSEDGEEGRFSGDFATRKEAEVDALKRGWHYIGKEIGDSSILFYEVGGAFPTSVAESCEDWG